MKEKWERGCDSRKIPICSSCTYANCNEDERNKEKTSFFLLSAFPADDKASSEATGLWSGGGERHQRAQLLPLHGLGETGEQGGAAAIQTESCKSDPAKDDATQNMCRSEAN